MCSKAEAAAEGHTVSEAGEGRSSMEAEGEVGGGHWRPAGGTFSMRRGDEGTMPAPACPALSAAPCHHPKSGAQDGSLNEVPAGLSCGPTYDASTASASSLMIPIRLGQSGLKVD